MTHDDDMGDLGAALARAEAAVKALARDYLGWASADLDLCRQHLSAAQQQPVRQQEHITALFGVAHNIKGQGTSFGYPLMTRLGESLCQLTRRPRVFSSDELALMDRHLQIMAEILTQEASGDGTPGVEENVKGIEAAVSVLGLTA